VILRIPDDLPECPQCGSPVRQAERVSVSARVEPCGHFVAAETFQPAHIEEPLGQALVTDGGDGR
jgi:hypothetical protein